MRNSLIIVLTSITIAAASARADTLILDNYTGNTAAFAGTTTRVAGDDPLTVLTVTTTTTIDRMGIYDSASAGDAEFLVFSSAGSLLYNSGSHTFAGDASGIYSWKYSMPFSFTLQAGSTYYLGAILDVASITPYTITSITTQNGLTSPDIGNGNVDNFASPTFEGTAYANLPLQLYTVPEPSSLVMLLGLGVSGAVAGLRVRRGAR